MARAKLYQWPPPVYVAKFAGGEEIRMSVSSTVKNAYGFDRARSICCGVIGGERGRKRVRVSEWRYANFPPATDQTAGHFEHDGKVIPDPFFVAGGGLVEKPKADPVARLIASLNKLTPDQLARLSVEIDLRLETV